MDTYAIIRAAKLAGINDKKYNHAFGWAALSLVPPSAGRALAIVPVTDLFFPLSVLRIARGDAAGSQDGNKNGKWNSSGAGGLHGVGAFPLNLKAKKESLTQAIGHSVKRR